MKPVITNILSACFAGLLMMGCASTKTYKPLEASDIVQMVQSHEFNFVAEKMNPLRGPQRNLNSYYDLLVTGDTLKSFLPYYGRAFVAPIDPSKGGLRFNSYDFTYESSKEDGRWNVAIIPKDVSDISKLTFTIFDNGNTTLHVNSVSKDPISFTGYVEKLK